MKEGRKAGSGRKPSDKNGSGKHSNKAGREPEGKVNGSGRQPNDKDGSGKCSNKVGREPEGKVNKGKGQGTEQAAGIDNGESDEGDEGAENEVYTRQRLTTAHDYHHGVTDTLLGQLHCWRPEAIQKCKGGTMPYKHFLTFALDNHVWLVGWPVENVPRFPGDLLFDMDKMWKRE